MAKRWLPANPLAAVQGKGGRRHGKPQLRIDEARKWMDCARAHADRGESGAVAALMTLLMGLRAGEITDREVDDEASLLWIPEAKTEAGRRAVEIPEALRPYLKAITEGRRGDEPLFGQHWRDWPRKWVDRICREAGVPEVCAHSMRGLHATLATDRGATGSIVAAALGHVSQTTTYRSYAKPQAVRSAQQRRVLKVLGGGR